MNRTVPIHTGRPLYSRARFGYKGDLANLNKLRYACLIDMRIPTRTYQTIAHHVNLIAKALGPFSKTRTRGAPKRKRTPAKA